ncbi:hypothetical protein L3X38_008310 [Prunus dulcis]|uniref:Uncharacterized protein n=1 Tax=Prunus dulcis TaxID=3755 RepID=A0AAD5F706_PRUDU|nr:hypothetical protein L3X38_008310 [Prunus dulcis]
MELAHVSTRPRLILISLFKPSPNSQTLTSSQTLCKTKSTIGNLLSSFIDSSSSEMSLSYRDYLTLLLLRPLFAIAVVFSFISVGWWLAWKLVLVHPAIRLLNERKALGKLGKQTW